MWISLTGLNSLGPTHQWLEPDQPPWCWLASHLLGSDSGLWVWEIQLGSHLSYAYLGQDTPRQQSRQRCAWLCTSTMLLLPPPPHVTASCHLGTSLLSWIDAPESSSTHGEGQQHLGRMETLIWTATTTTSASCLEEEPFISNVEIRNGLWDICWTYVLGMPCKRMMMMMCQGKSPPFVWPKEGKIILLGEKSATSRHGYMFPHRSTLILL